MQLLKTNSLLAFAPWVIGQTRPPAEMPTLERFNASLVDPTVNPCTDFHQYVCGKWMAAHPIPPDQRTWGTWSPLQLWNDTSQTLEKLSSADAKRTANEQKVGDYYFACMDEASIAAHTKEWVKQELDRIGAIHSKRELAAEVAHLHQSLRRA
jgi:endothelin-converting enzyme/putative endopeptidase